jgi:hypothetical protein
MKLILVILLVCIPAASQEKDALTAKYGNPKSETYHVRAGIDLTVVRNAKGRVCSMLIFPETAPDALLVGGSEKTIDEKVLNGLIDELVPSDQRGKFLQGSVLNSFCINDCGCTGNGNLSEYERVYVFLARSKTKSEKRYAEIRWKDCAD